MKYPLIKDLGLEPFWIQAPKGRHWILADDLERVLSEGVEVYGFGINDGADWAQDSRGGRTHKGLLIGVKPIKQETCRDVLKDALHMIAFSGEKYVDAYEVLDRAKAAIDREQE